MRITAITARPYRIPFRHPFATAHGVLTARDGAIVSIATDVGFTGHGDLAAVPEFAGPSLPTLLVAMWDAAHMLVGQEPASALRQVQQDIVAGALLSSVGFALETAIYDLMGRSAGVSLAHVLTPTPRNAIPVNIVIGDPTLAGAIAAAQRAMAVGFRCVKLKVGIASDPDAEYQRIAAVRDALDPALHLRLDANEAWSLAEATDMITRCADLALQYIEQPLPRADLAGMRMLRQRVAIPIAADEALTDLASIHRVLTADAADILVIKPQMLGGWLALAAVGREALIQEKQIVVTSVLESGIGVAAALHLAAASPQLTLACGLATLDLLEDDLIIGCLPIAHGAMAVPTGPGLGVTVDEDALARYSYDPDA